MTDVIVVGEGQTEETFVRTVLSPALAAKATYVSPRLISSSPTKRGGALSYPRVLRFLRNTLRERTDTYVTTFFDLYALDNEFPGYAEARSFSDPLARTTVIEDRLKDAVVREAGCRGERFFAHIQPYEFEALLFSHIERLVEIEPNWAAFAPELRAVRSQSQSPEHMNDGLETHPSERLVRILRPRYRKVLHGPMAALNIGLGTMAQECLHFGKWLARLQGL